MSDKRVFWITPAVVVALTGSAAAQPEPPAPEPAPAPAPAAAANSEQPEAPLPPDASAATSQRNLDAQAAVSEALRGNPSRQAAQLDIDKATQSVLAEEGRYPYVFQADAGYTRSSNPRLGAGDTVSTTTSRSYTVGSAIRRNFPSGTVAEIRVEGERFENDVSSSSFGGSGVGSGYNTSARASVTQPLLRNFGTRVGEAELRSARVSRGTAEKSRDRVDSELVRDVLTSYWELWYASESVRIEQAALDLAKQQEKDAQDRVGQGALAPADVFTFSTRVANLEESVVSADSLQRSRSLDLARMMGNSDDAVQLVATTPPPTPGPVATRAEIEAALRSGSLELAELESQVKLARTRAEVAGESSRPRLDLEAYVESQGVSERIPKAVERTGRMGWLTVHVGAVFELPLDDSKKNAERQGALLGVRIAEQNLRSARDRIRADAVRTVSDENNAIRRVALAERTLKVAIKAHAAEKERFALGQSLAIQVQQAEDEVRRARLRVARARVDLAQAQVAVLHLAGKLVDRWGDGARARN